MPLPTDCCCEPIYIPSSISGSWPLTPGPGKSWSLSCWLGHSTRLFRPAISPTRQQPGSVRTKRPWRSSGNTFARPKTAAKKGLAHVFSLPASVIRLLDAEGILQPDISCRFGSPGEYAAKIEKTAALSQVKRK
jgi:hypothetical protein